MRARILANQTVTKVISEETSVRTTRRHGVPIEVHEVESTYLLSCGHEAHRTRPFNKPRLGAGTRLHCHACVETTPSQLEGSP